MKMYIFVRESNIESETGQNKQTKSPFRTWFVEE